MSSGVWLRPTAVLIGVYFVLLLAATVLLRPVIQNVDWTVFERLSNVHAPAFSPRIAVVDLPYDLKNPKLIRPTVASFLDTLPKNENAPAAVLIDVYFPSETCAPPNDPQFCDRLKKSLQQAPKGVYVSVSHDNGDVDATSLLILDFPNVYDNAEYGHTTLELQSAGGAEYLRCYHIPKPADGQGHFGDVFALPFKIAHPLSPQADPPVCDPALVEVIRLGPRADFSKRVYDFKDGRVIPRDPDAAPFDATGKYLIVASLEHDPDPPRVGGPSNPELVAWALSDQLEGGNVDSKYYRPFLARGLPAMLVLGLTIVTVMAFIGLFQGLRRLRLQALRPVLPWIAAAGAAVFALAVFAGIEWLMLAAKLIQPQVFLVVLSIVLAAVLSGERGREMLFEQSRLIDAPPEDANDYDAFISYAHEEGAWVHEHVYLPLKNARTSDGRALSIFYDTSSIQVGSGWQDKISLAIDGSRFVVPVYSEIYFGRSYCNYEIRRAVLKSRKERDAGGADCVLPIMRGKPAIPAAVDDIQAISIDERPDLVSQIVAIILARLDARKPPAVTAPAREAS